MKITKEIKASVLVIASVAFFIWGYNFLKGKDLLSTYKTFYIQYDNVEGLSLSAPVTINGLTVGKINDIKFLDNTGMLVVEIQVKTDFPISKTSVAAIYEPGFIGGKQIMILPNLKDNQMAESGATLEGTHKVGPIDQVLGRFSPMQIKLEKIITNAETLLASMNEVLDAKTRENLRNSIVNLNETLAGFKEASETANDLMVENKGKINSTITNLNKTSSNFSKISDSLAKINLSKTVKNLEKTMVNFDKIMSDVQDGKGSMGKLMKDDALYNNFTNSSKELELLLQDVRLNPIRYINVSLFGKKNKPYIAPSEEALSN